jgi:hypothetical protein
LPVNQSRQDWVITAQLAKTLGVDFGYQMAASAVFREIAEKVPAYGGLRYPLLKDEKNPVQVKHPVTGAGLSNVMEQLRATVESMPEGGEKIYGTPRVGHELFKTGTLTSKVPQFHLLEAGNPEPPTVLVSPLYQISIDPNMKRAEPVAVD